MARMGHDSVRAAMIYQHATSDADRAIADALGAHLDATSTDQETAAPASANGTPMARAADA